VIVAILKKKSNVNIKSKSKIISHSDICCSESNPFPERKIFSDKILIVEFAGDTASAVAKGIALK
jgi:hypothetical protein